LRIILELPAITAPTLKDLGIAPKDGSALGRTVRRRDMAGALRPDQEASRAEKSRERSSTEEAHLKLNDLQKCQALRKMANTKALIVFQSCWSMSSAIVSVQGWLQSRLRRDIQPT